MNTKIYPDYAAFMARADKSENGVSAAFAELHPDFAKENESNNACWNCANCAGCAGCADCADCAGCARCANSSGCAGCAGCANSSGCADCAGCAYCAGCADLRNATPVSQEPGKSWFDVPQIPNLHQTVLAAVEKPGALCMNTWHTCETTHCRAGWIVTLAGEKGRALELASGTLFAAMQICKASSPIGVSPVRFFETDEIALADMRRCAAEEKALEVAS